MKRHATNFLLIFSILHGFAQQKEQDSTKATALQQVVVTGQFEPQSVRKSVHNVRVISKNDIQRLAANNLADVLNQYLNISITPSSGTGRSTVSMFGLNGNYFKILVDNIPLVSESNFGNNIDLNQVNLEDIEQIEIIEGSMGVTHGANAVSGILNIITKKGSKHQWEISATVQEETVGKEFEFFDKGRHIQSAKVLHNITDHWFASIGFNRNDFRGFLDGRKGKDYQEANLRRGYTWLPKQQYIGNALLGYRKNDFQAFYKFDYFNENIDFYNPAIQITTVAPFPSTIIAKDRRFKIQRTYHHLNLDGKLLHRLKYNVSFSHQLQQRQVDSLDYNLVSRHEANLKKTKMQATEILYSTGTLSNFFKSDFANLQLGYEYVNNLGFAVVDTDNQKTKEVEKRLTNFDFFVSSEIKPTSRFSIRAGLRASSQSLFKDQYASSVGLRYLFDKGYELRGSLGKSFRTPDFDELYSRINFSSHHFYGNENLIPENSTSYEINFRKTSAFASGFKIANNVSAAFLDIDDRIDMAFVGYEGQNEPVYQAININRYNMWNVAANTEIEYKNLNFRAGISYAGISQVIDNGEIISDDRYLYSLQMNGNLTYNFKKINTQFTLFCKYNGRQQQFVAVTENQETVYRISEIDAYTFVDASVKKSFFTNRFDATIGARNILDVTRIQQGLATAGAHDATTNILMGYGRSYFLKLTYNLNF